MKAAHCTEQLQEWKITYDQTNLSQLGITCVVSNVLITHVTEWQRNVLDDSKQIFNEKFNGDVNSSAAKTLKFLSRFLIISVSSCRCFFFNQPLVLRCCSCRRCADARQLTVMSEFPWRDTSCKEFNGECILMKMEEIVLFLITSKTKKMKNWIITS